MSAIEDIALERKRQVESEGYDAAHDDAHTDGSLARAAAAYAMTAARPLAANIGIWPWAYMYWKPKDKRTNLVKSAALIIAEIERIDRAAALSSTDRS